MPFHELEEAVIAGDACEVGERPERPRGEKRVAIAPQHASRRPDLLAETAQDGCLAHPRLARHQHGATSTLTRVGERLAQALQHLFALEKLGTAPDCRYRHLPNDGC